MKVKQRKFSGCVCEQLVYTVSDKVRDVASAAPSFRFKDEEERRQHRLGISRRKFARIVNENFSPSSFYSTLTFSDEWEVHTFKDARRIRDNFVRRLQSSCPDVRLVIVMGRGKGTKRIHFHMISDGAAPELIEKKWFCGDIISCVKLREHNFYEGVDYGQDYTALANYLFNHWTEEQGGHRWKQTRNMRKPEEEDPKETKRNYSANKPPKAPKGYKLVEMTSTRYGFLYFKYVRDTEAEKQEKLSSKKGQLD